MSGVDSVQEVIDRQENDRVAKERLAHLARQQVAYKTGFAEGYATAVAEGDESRMGRWWNLTAAFFALGAVLGLVIGYLAHGG